MYSFLTVALVLPASLMPATPSVAAAPTYAASSAVLNDAYAHRVLDLMNTARVAAGLAPLKWNQSIADVSQAWADHLGVVTQDPEFDFDQIHRWDGGGHEIPAGADWYAEIIAFNFTAANVVDWWMNSASHRSALLDSRETDVGIGVATPTTGPYAGWHLVVSNLAGYPQSRSYFSDVAEGSQFAKEISWLARCGISTGWSEPGGTRTFRPLEAVARDAMAAFLYRMAGNPAYTPPAKSPFVDVTTNNQFYKQITWLASTGISTGWTEPDGTRTFRPLDTVARDAMAAFLYRMASNPAYTPPAKSPFVDVSAKSQFYKEITWLSSKGISTGWDDGNGSRSYRPLLPVNRDAMASFLFNYTTKA